jgi:putative hemolysin
MNQVTSEIVFILLLLLANGVFAMAEIAVVSAKRARLRRLAEQGDARAKLALELAESPNRFLATVQIGITLVGIVAGAFGGATITAKLKPVVAQVGFLAPYAEKIAFALVVAVITYLSLVFGELVPKRVGLSNPEGIARLIARPMSWLAWIANPLVTFLSVSTEGLLRCIGFKPEKEATVSEEEVRALMQEGLRAGAFNKVESHIIHSALELDQLPVADIMTPRNKIIWLNQDDPHDQVWHKIVVSSHSYFPVHAGNRDQVLGFVSVKSIYANLAAGVPIVLRNLVVPPLVVPESQNVLQLVETYKATGKHAALVADEFGQIVGLVTLNDVMEAVVGEFPSTDQRARPEAKRREDGTWLVDAMLDIEALERALPGFRFGPGSGTDFQTVAGYVLKHFGSIPREGETFTDQGYVFEVLDMDGHRVDKVLVLPAKPAAEAAPGSAASAR